MSNTNYIHWKDYSISISNTNLDEIVTQAAEMTDLTKDQIMDNAELTAQAEVRSYLKNKYQIDEEFDIDYDTVPDVRNKLTIKCVVCISLFHLHMTINPRDVPEKVEKAYDRCVEMLDAARRGELDFGLPAQDATTGTPVDWRNIGSNEKFTSKEFDEARIIAGDI